MALTYKDGKTAPQKGDTVIGNRLKGQVAEVREKDVVVASRGAWDKDEPNRKNEVRTPVDPGLLELVHRK